MLMLLGNKVVTDFGIFSETRFYGNYQTLRLLKCKKAEKILYIIEESSQLSHQGGLRVSWIKLDEDNMDKLITTIKGGLQ